MPAAAIDVLVRGAGPVGCVAALALAPHHPTRILAYESRAVGWRPIVLSYASRLILERVGVWDALRVTPIQTIRVSRAGRFGRTVFDAADSGVPALGYVLEYSALLQALHFAVQGLFTDSAVNARCVVHAEGAAPESDEKRYPQDALVASVRFAPSAGATAFERFTDEGPLALLPHEGRYAVVWSMHPARARELANAAEAQFLEALAACAGTRAGRPLEVDARSVQPLVLRVKRRSVGERAVHIGNAAQTLHPVAGQGLNLGLRDAWDLAQIMRNASDPGDAATLARFAARRRPDARGAIHVTDALARAFLQPSPFVSVLAGAALTALDILPAPRRYFARRMIFGASALP
jgi:2-octaprenyl-6-methoxyphenol hydroxylase